jgi:hypothetical protein
MSVYLGQRRSLKTKFICVYQRALEHNIVGAVISIPPSNLTKVTPGRHLGFSAKEMMGEISGKQTRPLHQKTYVLI